MRTARVAPPPPVEFELLPEPPLMFGGSTTARDPKAGLALAGPAGLDTSLHPTEIDIALIGTGATIDAGQRWIESCANVVPGSAKKPRQVLDFPGFSPTSPFKSVMRPQQATQGLITDMDVRSITGEQRYEEGFKRAVDLLTEKVTLTCESLPGARVIFCAIPQPTVDYCMKAGSYLRRHGSSNALMSKLLKLEEDHGQLPLFARSAAGQRGEDVVYRNLRRALKATTMKLRKPLQLRLETSLFPRGPSTPQPRPGIFALRSITKPLVRSRGGSKAWTPTPALWASVSSRKSPARVPSRCALVSRRCSPATAMGLLCAATHSAGNSVNHRIFPAKTPKPS